MIENLIQACAVVALAYFYATEGTWEGGRGGAEEGSETPVLDAARETIFKEGNKTNTHTWFTPKGVGGHIYIYIGGWGGELNREIVLPCLLACTHARTHAHTAQYGRFGCVNLSGPSVRRSVRFWFRLLFGISRVFLCTLQFSEECLEDFA